MKTPEEIRAEIQREWDKKVHIVVDWLALENTIRDALRLCAEGDPAFATVAIELIDDAVAAFTRRGNELQTFR